MKQDGKSKNDCERNAAKRFLTDFQQKHPHLHLIVTGDGLTSNAPFGMLRENAMNFILGWKSCDQKSLLELIHNKDTP